MKKIKFAECLMAFVLVVFGTFTSCIKSHVTDPLKDFKKESILKPTRVINLDDYGVLKPRDILKYKNGYIVMDQTRTNVLKYIELGDKEKVITGVSIGNGPGEVTIATDLQRKDNEIIISDSNKRIFYSVKVTRDTILLEEYHKNRRFVQNFKLFDDKKVMNFFGENNNSWYYLVNEEDSILSSVKFPKYYNNNSNFINKHLFGNSYFTIKPDHKKLAAICHHQGLISFSNINDSKLEQYKLLFYYSGKYKNFSDHVVSTSDSRWGFSHLVSDDSFIYTIYSDKTFLKDKYDVDDCDYLLVYDWEGNPIKKYKLDKTLVNLEIDEETKMLYGRGKDYTLVEYQVPTKEELLSKN